MGGYQQSINFGHEVKNASRNVPKGIFIGIATIIILYLAVNFSYYKLIGFEQLKTTNEIASVVAEKMFGPTGLHCFLRLALPFRTGVCERIAHEQSPM